MAKMNMFQNQQRENVKNQMQKGKLLLKKKKNIIQMRALKKKKKRIGGLISKDGTEWYETTLPQNQTIRRNILRQRNRASKFSASFTAKKTFKSLIYTQICNLILQETNKKGQKRTSNQPSRDGSGRDSVVGSCNICGQKIHKKRKTRKARSVSIKSICNQHSISTPNVRFLINSMNDRIIFFIGLFIIFCIINS